MTRGAGEVDLFQQVVPESLAFPVAALTQLGSLWFVTLVLYGVYRVYDRHEALVTWALLMGGTACWRAIKTSFPTDRPQQPFAMAGEFPVVLDRLYDFFVIDTGAGFPSGHAVTTAIVYLSLARILPVGTPARRYGAAVGVITLVGATRITLGVHHAVDVVGGALLGHGILLGAGLILGSEAPERVRRAFGLALVLTTLNLVVVSAVGPFSPEDLLLLTALLTVFVWWYATTAGWDVDVPYLPLRPSRPLLRAALFLAVVAQAVGAVSATGVTILLP